MMYGFIMGIVFILSVAAVWRLLGRTALRPAWRVTVTALIAVPVCLLLYWASLYGSILLFQLRDRLMM